jgi:hypothetical protein
MKKILSTGLLTLCALAITQQQAHAWLNAKFSVGLNWHIQSANNNVLWGLWKNGQVPGPEAFGGGGGSPFPAGVGPGPYMTPPGQFPFFGSNPQGAPQGQPASFPIETAPPPTVAAQPQSYYPMPPYGNPNPFQTVSYQNNGYYNPNYYYPTYYNPSYYQGYGYQAQVPYYWNQGR